MRTNIVLEEDIVREAFKYSRAKTKKDLIHEDTDFDHIAKPVKLRMY